MTRTFVILFGLFFFFSACEQEAVLDVTPIPSKLVIISNFRSASEQMVLAENDFFERDSVMRVTVSRTSPALSSIGDTLIHVPDAVVELYEGEQFLERLDYTIPTSEEEENGFQPYYSSKSYRLQPGKTYVLEVSAPNFSTVRAEGFIPQILSETTSSIDTVGMVTSNGFREVNYTLSLEIEDLVGIKNYYHLNLYQVINLLRFSPNGESSRDGIVIKGPLPFNLQNNNQEVLPYINNEGVLIRDDTFDGQKGEFVFKGNFRYNPRSQELGDFIVEVRNTSRDYYLYHSSLARQVRVQSGFDAISGPVVLYNNVENGYGIFAGYVPVFTTLDLSD